MLVVAVVLGDALASTKILHPCTTCNQHPIQQSMLAVATTLLAAAIIMLAATTVLVAATAMLAAATDRWHVGV